MAPERLKRNIACLHLLSKATKPQREALINTASYDQIRCICDCAQNFLNENIPFTDTEIKQLLRHQNLIRYLAASKNHRDIKHKKNLIIQNGGFLPLLLTPILTVAGSLLADAISGKL